MNRPELEPSTPRTLSEYSHYLTIGPHGKPVTNFPCFNQLQYPLFLSAVHIRELHLKFIGGGGGRNMFLGLDIFSSVSRSCLFICN